MAYAASAINFEAFLLTAGLQLQPAAPAAVG